mmetsp:Transcript_74616/g.118769  ORF Transcript_74616/g.118769 Transcript_74616/m.118769 type:complete len:110 (+) Transcript_74616:99-428(+)|eukprot:CAMPEP_0197034814 /NCGR_PEP_ID=MMETSP1384-20130603/12783_1 /TAXON_ID=29189 /ORGANISM="Ammonia sp." /LENGTH=109 /DNA_ID=CAMNT_0042464773 /DNA_START=81 /DNA_END=410 /DNA_ORIENTATION=+
MAEQKEDKSIHVVVTWEVKEDKIDAFLAAVKPMVMATNKEKGCLRYNLHQDKKNQCKFVMVEEWDSQENLSEHLKSAHVKAFGEEKKKQDFDQKPPAIYFCGGPVFNLE